VSPGEPPPIFFCFLFLSYFLFLNSVLIQIWILLYFAGIWIYRPLWLNLIWFWNMLY
jgi:hypothetical protein